MRRQWKRSVPLIFAGSLVACSSAGDIHQTRLDELTLPPGGTATIVHPQLQEKVSDKSAEASLKAKTDTVRKTESSDPDKDKPSPSENPPHEKPPVYHYTKMGDGRLLLGQYEWTLLSGVELVFKARMASDQKLSSVNVMDVHYFMRNGQQWVTFQVHSGKATAGMSLPVRNWIEEKRGDSVIRVPVVMNWIEIGDVKEPVAFKLYQDEENALSSVKIGQNFLKEKAVIDSSRQLIQPYPTSG